MMLLQEQMGLLDTHLRLINKAEQRTRPHDVMWTIGALIHFEYVPRYFLESFRKFHEVFQRYFVFAAGHPSRNTSKVERVIPYGDIWVGGLVDTRCDESVPGPIDVWQVDVVFLVGRSVVVCGVVVGDEIDPRAAYEDYGRLRELRRGIFQQVAQ